MLFLCENNLYAMGTALGRHQSQTDIARKADAYAIPAEAVNGMDVLAVEAATRKAIDFVRAVTGRIFWSTEPTGFVPIRCTMRSCIARRTRSPNGSSVTLSPSFEQQLRAEGYLSDADLENMETAIAAEIEEAVSLRREQARGNRWRI